MFGAAAGLPLPLESAGHAPNSWDAGALASGSLTPIDQGTAVSPTEGPFHPILDAKVDYGQAAARFGAPRGSGFHEGQDMFAPPGTPLVAVRSGTVVDWGAVNGPFSGGRGNYIAIWAPQDRRSYVYLHMQQPSPYRVGQNVNAGQIIGHIGCTGDCQGPHLHFEIRLGKATLRAHPKPIDPLPLVRIWPEASHP